MKNTRINVVSLMGAFVLCLMLTSTPANAYYYTKHNAYTHLAYELLNQCPSVDLALPIEHLANGTEWEDSTQLITRSLNWHFYKSNDEIKDTWLTYRSFHNIYEQRIDELHELIESGASDEDTLVAAGRVLHYIQDVAVPAHVVPVFHGPFPFPQDKFDNYEFPIENEQHKLALSFTSAECQLIQAESFDYQGLLTAAAEDTLAAIETPIKPNNEQKVTGKWNLYWQEKDSWFLAGFGSYGEVGNYFGEEIELNPEQCKASDCVVGKEEYQRFYKTRLKSALVNTARFIHFLNQRLYLKETKLSSK